MSDDEERVGERMPSEDEDAGGLPTVAGPVAHGGDGASEGSGGSGMDPAAQFDAFRARRADDRAQQETQSAYTFPPEYAAPPPDTAYAAVPPPPTGPFALDQDPGRAEGRGGRWRSVAVFAGAIVAAGALGLGAWAAFGSSGPSSGNAAAGATATSTATGGTAGTGAGAGAGKHARGVLTFRVAIVSVGADSFTGTVLGDGRNVTVALTDKTRYGTKAHPFGRTDLAAGRTVIVRGRRTGTDTVTATLVTANIAPSAGAGGDATEGAAGAAA